MDDNNIFFYDKNIYHTIIELLFILENPSSFSRLYFIAVDSIPWLYNVRDLIQRNGITASTNEWILNDAS